MPAPAGETKGGAAMNTNRITPYEAGWLSMLVATGLASRDEATEARNRVAQEAVRELEARARAKRAAKRRKKRRDG